MSEKKLNKVTQKLDVIKNMSEDELQNRIVRLNGKNVALGASVIGFVLASILLLGFSIPTLFLTKIVGWVLLGLGVTSGVMSGVSHAVRKKSLKEVADCTAELGLRVKQETDKEFEYAKKEVNLIVRAKSKTASKYTQKTNNNRKSNTKGENPKTSKNKKKKPYTQKKKEDSNIADI